MSLLLVIVTMFSQDVLAGRTQFPRIGCRASTARTRHMPVMLVLAGRTQRPRANGGPSTAGTVLLLTGRAQRALLGAPSPTPGTGHELVFDLLEDVLARKTIHGCCPRRPAAGAAVVNTIGHTVSLVVVGFVPFLG